MSSILHHSSALGWGWAALFVLFDAVAVVCALLVVVGRKRRWALRAVLLAAATTLASFGAANAAVAVGLDAADAAQGAADPSRSAAGMADGISVAMNGAALGFLSTLVTGVATVVCLVGMVVLHARSGSDEKPQTSSG